MAPSADIYRGTLLRAIATYCIGIAERSYLLGKGFGYALKRTIEKRNEKD